MPMRNRCHNWETARGGGNIVRFFWGECAIEHALQYKFWRPQGVGRGQRGGERIIGGGKESPPENPKKSKITRFRASLGIFYINRLFRCFPFQTFLRFRAGGSCERRVANNDSWKVGNGRNTVSRVLFRRRELTEPHWVSGQTRWVQWKTWWVRFGTQIIGLEELSSVSPKKLTEFGVWNRALRNRIRPVWRGHPCRASRWKKKIVQIWGGEKLLNFVEKCRWNILKRPERG